MGALGLSISCVLFSPLLQSPRDAMCARDLNNDALNFENRGRRWDDAINILNPIGGGLFFIGLVSLLFFVSYNVNSEKQTGQSLTKTDSNNHTTTTTTENEDVQSLTSPIKTNSVKSH